MDIKKLLAELESQGALHSDDVVSCDKLEGAKPVHYGGGVDSFLSPKMCGALAATGINNLYQHQVDAIAASLDNDVVLDSPTASGKTLAFTAPMMEAVMSGGTALMVYPMKALAFDQTRQIKTMAEELGITYSPFDGDTPNEIKKSIKISPRDILLTNPEYLHLSFLQAHKTWHPFLEKLRFIVFDESHEYRGYFGGHMSQIVRRLLAVLERMGANPNIFMSTATCQNPGEHAYALTGRKNFKVISAKTAGCSPRSYITVRHTIPDGKEFLGAFCSRIVNAAVACLSLGHSVLVYCPYVFFAEKAFEQAKKEAKKAGLDFGKIAVFHAGIKAGKKRALQEDMQNGDISVVFCTNALELGIDVGRLDGVILAGFPDNIAAARQRIGRAGRDWKKDAFVVYYPMNNPLDRFFAANFRTFLGMPLSDIVIDPDNEEISEQHSPFWGYEKEGGYFRPKYLINIRGSKGSAELVADEKTIGNISEARAFREGYIGAVIVHDGQKYRVREHIKGKGNQRIILQSGADDIRTEPSFNFPKIVKPVSLKSNSYRNDDEEFQFDLHFCKLDIVEEFRGYKAVHEKSGKVLENVNAPETMWHNNRYAFAAHLHGVRHSSEIGVRTLKHLFRIGAMFVVPADRHDTSTHSEKGMLYVYENYPGGIGVARQIFESWQEVIKKGADIARNCSCATGCPNCIVPPGKSEEMDKNTGIRLADYILATVADCGQAEQGDEAAADDVMRQFFEATLSAKHRSNAPELGGEKSGDGIIPLVKPGSPCCMDNGETIVVGGVIIDGKKPFYRAHMAQDADVRVLVPTDKVSRCEGTEWQNFNLDTGKYEGE
ncbi:MAG: DEAD/DEAH box helicase [Gammaproteobacteria bacterium]